MKKEPDKLAEDAAKARAANMTYGKWKAMQQPVEPMERKQYGKKCVCRGCGNTFFLVPGEKRKYCDESCKWHGIYERRKKRMVEKQASCT